jgi:hypothetical protein
VDRNSVIVVFLVPPASAAGSAAFQSDARLCGIFRSNSDVVVRLPQDFALLQATNRQLRSVTAAAAFTTVKAAILL